MGKKKEPKLFARKFSYEITPSEVVKCRNEKELGMYDALRILRYHKCAEGIEKVDNIDDVKAVLRALLVIAQNR